MEALVVRARCALLFAAFSTLVWCPTANAASHRTTNFIVTAANKALAVEIAESAERYRADLAVQWLGRELPRWREPCPIRADVGQHLGAGGATSFIFETKEHMFARPVSRPAGDGLFQAQPAGQPRGWRMSVQGSRQRVLDSVLPHEVTHTIFATHFGRPLPRWADEGACTTVEHVSEKAKQHHMLYRFLKDDKGIAFNRMFSMDEYPADILPLYSQGFSLVRFLLAQGGRQKFVQYVGDGLDTNDWTASTRKHYGFSSISDLQVTWLDWVRAGSPNTVPSHQDQRPARPGFERDFNAVPRGIARTDLAPAPRGNELAANSSTSSNASGTSWYAQQKNAAKSGGNRRPSSEFTPLAAATPKNGNRLSGDLNSDRTMDSRLASRPNTVARQREVMLEWGSPSPFLAPRLAKEAANDWR